MQKKIYVAGLIDEGGEQAINQAVSAIPGVTSCTASAMKAQVLVDFDESCLLAMALTTLSGMFSSKQAIRSPSL